MHFEMVTNTVMYQNGTLRSIPQSTISWSKLQHPINMTILTIGYHYWTLGWSVGREQTISPLMAGKDCWLYNVIGQWFPQANGKCTLSKYDISLHDYTHAIVAMKPVISSYKCIPQKLIVPNFFRLSIFFDWI